MDQGDFFVHFMDLTEEELKKPVDDIITTRLEALLELALRMSTANTDPFKDDLKVKKCVSGRLAMYWGNLRVSLWETAENAVEERRIGGYISVGLLGWSMFISLTLAMGSSDHAARGCIFLLMSEHRESAFEWHQDEVKGVMYLSAAFSSLDVHFGVQENHWL